MLLEKELGMFRIMQWVYSMSSFINSGFLAKDHHIHSTPPHALFPCITSSRYQLFFEDWFVLAGGPEKWAYSLAKVTPNLLKCWNTEDSQYCFGNMTSFITVFDPSWSKDLKPYWVTLRTLGKCASIACELEERGTEPSGPNRGWRIWKTDTRRGRKKRANGT